MQLRLNITPPLKVYIDLADKKVIPICLPYAMKKARLTTDAKGTVHEGASSLLRVMTIWLMIPTKLKRMSLYH